MTRPVVVVGVVSYGTQPPNWWQHLAMMIAKLPEYGIEIGGLLSASSMSADMNRNEVAKSFLRGKADYLLWVDTDNIIPFGGVKRLLETGKELVSGLYHLKVPPYTPVAYWRQKDGNGYEPIHHFRQGEIVPVDMAGLGACLVHRNVFEEIQNQHTLLIRSNGTVLPMHHDDISGKVGGRQVEKPKVHNSQYLETMRLADPSKERTWPFHYLEYGRTEDVVFFEMAQRCGIQAYVDTSVDCPHIGPHEVTSKDSRDYLRVKKVEFKREQDWLEILKQEGLTDEQTQQTEDGSASEG